MKQLIILFLGLSGLLQAQVTDLEQALFELPDIIFKSIEAPEGYAEAFELHIKQPVDHKQPAKGHFYQRAFLSHRGFDRPTVMCTEGYDRPRNRRYELTDLIQGNQIDIEHRYFGSSIPEEVDYDYLNLEQATADLHHINQLFRQLYSEKWLSTGISKGGQTTIYYRYFYPDDVDVSVPYVAPLNMALEEERIYTFLDTVGTEVCRTALHEVQLDILQQRDAAINRLGWYAKGSGLSFTYLSFEEAFEYAVLEYPFAFWQGGGSCAEVPKADASLDEQLDHLLNISGLFLFSDRAMNAYGSHYYQAGAEMGYYSYETEEFAGLLKALPMEPHPSAIFMPPGEEKTFNGDLPRKVDSWLQENGHRFIYINGNSDTWSATAVRPTEGIDAAWFFLAGKDHGQARIRNMNEEEKALLVSTLERWLGMEIGD